MTDLETRLEVAETNVAKLQDALDAAQRTLAAADRGLATIERTRTMMRSPIALAAAIVAAGLAAFALLAVRRRVANSTT